MQARPHDAIAGYALAGVADHECERAVCPQPDEAVDDMSTGPLEDAGARHAVALVEPRAELDHGHNVCAALGGPGQGPHRRSVRGRPVERLLDRQQRRVGRRPIQQGHHRVPVRLMGEVNEHVPLVDGGEGICRFPHRGPAAFRFGPVRQGQRGEVGHAHQPVDGVDLAAAEIEFGHEPIERVSAGVGLDFQPDRGSVAVLTELALDGGQEVVEVGGDHTGLSRDPEDRAGLDVFAREERRDMGLHDSFHRNDAHARPAGAGPEPHEAAHHRGQLDGPEATPPGGIMHADGQVEREVGGRRQRPARIGHERDEHRQQPVAEDAFRRRAVLVVEFVPVAQLDAGVGDVTPQPLERFVLAVEEPLHALSHELSPAGDHRRGPHLRSGELEELVEETAHVGEHCDPLVHGRTVIGRERESSRRRVETAGVFVEVATALDLSHRATNCNRGLQGHQSTLRRGICPLREHKGTTP